MEEVQKRIATFIAVPEEAGGYLFWGETPGGWEALYVGTVGEILPFLDAQTVWRRATEYVLVTVGRGGHVNYSNAYSTEAALASNAAAARWVKFRDDQSEQRSYVARAAAAKAAAARLPAAPISHPPEKKIIVFIAVPRGLAAYAFWCEHEGKWGEVYNGPMAMAANLLRQSMLFRQGTEYVVLYLTSDELAAGVRKIEYSAGHSGQAATMSIGAYDRWVGHRRLAISDDVPRVVPQPAPEVAPEQKKEAEKEPCSFCPNHAIAGNSILSTCNLHAHVLVLHAERMEAGLIDCPETRAETLRFNARAESEQALTSARATGFRTEFDYKAPPPWVRKTPAEPVPLVGTTPHYEWP